VAKKKALDQGQTLAAEVDTLLQQRLEAMAEYHKVMLEMDKLLASASLVQTSALAKALAKSDILKNVFEAEAKEQKKLRDKLQAEIIKRFEAEEVDSIKVTVGGASISVYQRREVWPKLPDAGDDGRDPKEVLIEALKEDPDTAEFVKEDYNTQTLRGYIGRLEEDPETLLPVLPPHLEGKLKIVEIYKIGAVKA
jgi:hypothetical protein